MAQYRNVSYKLGRRSPFTKAGNVSAITWTVWSLCLEILAFDCSIDKASFSCLSATAGQVHRLLCYRAVRIAKPSWIVPVRMVFLLLCNCWEFQLTVLLYLKLSAAERCLLLVVPSFFVSHLACNPEFLTGISRYQHDIFIYCFNTRMCEWIRLAGHQKTIKMDSAFKSEC